MADPKDPKKEADDMDTHIIQNPNTDKIIVLPITPLPPAVPSTPTPEPPKKP